VGRGKKKAPRSVAPFDPRKRPVAPVNLDSVYALRPSWRLSQLEYDGPLGWLKLAPEKVEEVLRKLAAFEALTWGEILVKRKHWNHHNAVEKLSPAAQKRIKEIFPAQEELLSLHLSGEERVYGILQERGIMLVLWWDPDHSVYPVGKKGT
jgi:hypothetical protein